jgi:hypothetical protein
MTSGLAKRTLLRSGDVRFKNVFDRKIRRNLGAVLHWQILVMMIAFIT